MKIGDRVVNKLNGKHGTVVGIVRPIQIGHNPKIKLRMERDDGNFDIERPHNFCYEKDWVKPENRTWESEIADEQKSPLGRLTPMPDPEEKVEETPPKPMKGRKLKTEDAVADILNASE